MRLKKMLVLFILLAFSFGSAMAHGEVKDNTTHQMMEQESGSIAGMDLKNIDCNTTGDSDFAKLGSFWMEKMFGENHDSVDKMMMSQMGTSEQDMHVLMGKRMSGCVDARTGMMGDMMMSMMTAGTQGSGMSGTMGAGMGGGAIGSIFMILFLAVIILAIIWLYKQVRGPSTGAGKESALDIAKKRYAMGEITKEELEEIKKEIESR